MDVLRSTRVHGCANACTDKCDFVPLCVKGWDFFTEAGSSARPVKMQTLIRIFSIGAIASQIAFDNA